MRPRFLPGPAITPQVRFQHWVPLSFTVGTQEVAWTGQRFDEHIKPDTDLLCVKIHALAWERQTLLPILSILPNAQQHSNSKMELDALVTQSTQEKNVILWVGIRKEEPHHDRFPRQGLFLSQTGGHQLRQCKCWPGTTCIQLGALGSKNVSSHKLF